MATLTAFAPQFLACNEFLKGFVTYEIMSFLIVIVTITFASVANIHLSINKTQASVNDAAKRQHLEDNFAAPLREETSSSAWLLFWGLVICAICLFIKGQFPTNSYVVSGVHGIAVLILIMNAVVLYDIYSTVFGLVGLDNGDGQNSGNQP